MFKATNFWDGLFLIKSLLVQVPWLKLINYFPKPFKTHCKLVKEEERDAEIFLKSTQMAKKSPHLAIDINRKTAISEELLEHQRVGKKPHNMVCKHIGK